MAFSPRSLLRPAPQRVVDVVDDQATRRALIIELVIVFAVTFGYSGATAILSLIEKAINRSIGSSTVALNPSQSSLPVIDAVGELLRAGRLIAIGALGAYLLWRGGIILRKVGLGRIRTPDIPPALLLAAAIGLPGLAVVAIAGALGFNGHLVPSETDGIWWRWPLYILLAIGNAVAEEIIVVAYFITRLRQLGLSENSSLLASALMRGSYHLYQGVGGGLGNVAMGLVFGRYFQLTGRLWPLIIAHALIDVIAFIGYALLYPHLGWLTG